MSRKSAARRKEKASSKKKKKTVRRMEFAVIPECQDLSYAVNEYKTSREEKMWDPKVDVHGWIHHYSFAARVVLTYKQQHEGIPNMEAIENSSSGVAEQYISDVHHESEYVPYKALRMICMKDIPQKFIDKWKPEEMKLFTEGIMKYGKIFSMIRRELLPHKRVENFAEFSYVWKRSSMAEAWRKARAIVKAKEKEKEEKRSKKRTNKSPSNLPNNEPVCNVSNNRITTRSATAAANHSLQNSKRTDDDRKSSTLTSRSEKDEGTSSAAESTDSSKEHIQKPGNKLSETVTSEKSPTKNDQISDNSMKCTKQRRKRKLSITRKMVNYTSKKNLRMKLRKLNGSLHPLYRSGEGNEDANTLFNDTRAIYQCDM